jgi:TRAP-type transport system periplasmic protein
MTRILVVRAVPFVALLCLGFLGNPAPAGAEDVVLRFGHSSQITEPNHIFATRFAERMAELTKNKVTVKIYPQAQLGDEKSLVEQVRLGTVDVTVVASEVLVSTLPDFAAIGLPFAFRNYDQAHKFLDGRGGAALNADLETIGIVGLGYIDTGFRSIGNNTRAINTPADLVGLKIRVIPSPLLIDTNKAMGDTPVPISWADTISALQQGVVDGVETGNSYYYTARLWEYTKYFSYTNHIYTANVVMMSRATYNRLPKAAQEAVMQAAPDAIPVTRKYVADIEAKITPDLQAKGIKVNTVDPAPFRAKVQGIWEKFVPTIKPEIVQDLRVAMESM